MKFLSNFLLDRKELKELDFGMLIAAVLVFLFGVYNLRIATQQQFGDYLVRLQMFWLVLSLGVVYVILLMDYRKVYKVVDFFYWIIVLLLVFVLFTAATKGASGWFSIGTRGLQPGEFARLTTILMVGKVIQKFDGQINRPWNFIKVTILGGIPMLLLLLQPDMGLTMVLFFILLGIYFAVGLHFRVIFAGFAFIVLSVLVVLNTTFLPAHWQHRLTSFLFAEGSDLGIGYQLSQSIISIGSGGITGNQALQPYSARVPENHTDFIFSVIGEHFGLAGGVLLLTLYGYILYRMIRVAMKTEDLFGKVIAVGVFSSMLFSILQNVGMTMGVMPISGITLPLISYGGSSVLTNFIGIAMVLNVGMKKPTTLF